MKIMREEREKGRWKEDSKADKVKFVGENEIMDEERRRRREESKG